MRTDIQFLRGVAVLFVVIYHSGLGILNEGYLGVDIFFVISGFLITKLILEKLDKDEFRFSEFYYRRAKRLLPALYSTLALTTLLGVYFLTRTQWTDYLDQLLGALTFTANLVLPGQTGYFEQSSEGKPLLHIWSLSLEEQYYFLLPLFLFILPRKYRLIGLISLTTISIVWCFNWIVSEVQETPFLWRYNSATKYDWAFYLLPTRAWELLAGSLCAWIFINKPLFKTSKSFNYLALATLLLLSSVQISLTHPGLPAILTVICTSILLLGSGSWVPKNLVSQGVQKAGDWSYSIYLIHWPLFSFAHLGYVGDVPLFISVSIVFLSVFLGYLQYKFVETPFRSFRSNNMVWKPIVLSTTLLALPILFDVNHPRYKSAELEHVFRINHGLGMECEHSFDIYGEVKKHCIYGDSPDVALWGDSYAMHLAEGLKSNHQFIQLTKSVCGPLKDIALVKQGYNIQFAKSCIDYNDQAFDFIVKNDNIKTVVMSSPFEYYLNKNNKLLSKGGLLTSASKEVALKHTLQTIQLLKKNNKDVVIVSPPPKNGKDIGQCIERQIGPALLLIDNCKISINEYKKHQYEVNEFLNEVKGSVQVIMLESLLCDIAECKVILGSTPLYRDNGHLSIEGSSLLLQDLDLTRAIVNDI